jgi:hypothetical protein
MSERLGGGWGLCPRCGSTDSTEGNATGWTCSDCSLSYRPRGSRDPLTFVASGGFHGGPWNRRELLQLLDDASRAKRAESVPALLGRAAAIREERHRVLTEMTC